MADKVYDKESFIGKKYNSWTAEKVVKGKGKNRSKKLLCRCDCGNTSVVSPHSLINNLSTQCMECCAKEKTQYKEGDTHGSYTILELERKDGVLWYRSECKCGTIQLLKSGVIGTETQTKCKLCSDLARRKVAINAVWQRMIIAARRRNLPVNITKDFVVSLLIKQNYSCKLSGLPIVIASSTKEHASGKTTASIDRINSSRGYEEDNVQWVHKDINIMKCDHTDADFITYCKAVASHQSPLFNFDGNLQP